ncbi:MAG: hypothetical protein FWC89_05440 [Defluviitaleaceae bacterium]|nr:hypothetical protein [Defluviitaleaceae bacterium]
MSISHKNKDIIAKFLTQNYQNKSLAAYGLTHLPKIKRMLSADYPVVTATEFYGDHVFLLENDWLLVLEYESNPVWQDFLKYNKYAIFAVERLLEEGIRVKNVVIAVLYTGDVQKTVNYLDLGGFRVQVEQVYLSNFDTDAIYAELKAKIEAKERLTDEEVMKFIILPLTQPDKTRKQGLIVDTITLAQQIEDDKQQKFVLAGILTATNKFIDQEFASKTKEWLRMVKVIRLIVDEEVEAVENAAKARVLAAAKRLLLRGLTVEAIAEDMELDVSIVRELQVEIALSAV